MKKISIFFLVLLLVMSFSVIVRATDDTTEVELLEKSSDIITDTVAKVIEAKEAKDVVNGSMKDKVQEVTIEIIEGDYIGEEFTTEFILSYDIDGKILAYELEKEIKF